MWGYLGKTKKEITELTCKREGDVPTWGKWKGEFWAEGRESIMAWDCPIIMVRNKNLILTEAYLRPGVFVCACNWVA